MLSTRLEEAQGERSKLPASVEVAGCFQRQGDARRLKELEEENELLRKMLEQAKQKKRVGESDKPVPYPQKGIMFDFPNYATKEEIRKHDRLIVHGMAHLKSLTDEDLAKWSPPAQRPVPPVQTYIFTSNRNVQYIDALVMMLMKGQRPDELFRFTNITLINLERKKSYPHFESVLSKLPFLTPVDWSKPYLELSSMSSEQQYMHGYIRDHIRTLDLCLTTESPWCLLLEEDIAIPVNFYKTLDQFVLGALKGQEDKISSVSLFSYYNLPDKFSIRKRADFTQRSKKTLSLYTDDQYELERAKNNAERLALGLPPYKANFTVTTHYYPYGTVAGLYSRQAARRLRDFLIAHQDEGAMVDQLINTRKYFPESVGFPRKSVNPSLVNHIGFYSSHHVLEDGSMFQQLNTDIRHLVDIGER